MLTFIRALARNPIVGGIIVALLIAAFALFGVTDVFTGGGNAAVLVGQERVSVQELGRAYDRRLQQIQRENPRFTREQAEQFGLGEQVVQEMTAMAAIDAKTGELGLSLSDQRLFEAVRAIEAFQNPFSGDFDPQTYASLLRENGYATERLFEADLSEEMTRAQYLNAILGGVAAPEMLARTRRAYEEERRTVRALLIPPSLAGDVAEPTDEDLSGFISENAQVFRQPERRRFTLVRASPELFERDVDVSEEDLRELYTFRLENGELSDPPTRSLTQWLAPDQATAEAAAARIAAGEDAAAVVAELGLGEPVALETVEAFEVPDAQIAEAAFALGQGAVEAVEGRLGWRVLRIDSAVDPVAPTFEEQRTLLVTELAGDQAEGMMLDAVAVFEEARGAGATLEDAASQAGIPAERFDWLASDGSSPNGFRAFTLGESPEVLENVFSLPVGFAGDLTNFGDTGYFVARVDAIDPSRLPEVDEVRDQASTFWRLREVDNQLQALVDDALARAEAGESLNDIAAGLDGARVESATLGRTETAGPFNRQLVGQAFSVEQGQPFPARAGDQRTRAVVIVDAVIAPQDRPVSPERLAALNQELGNDVAIALENALLTGYEVRQDQRLIDLALGRIDPNDFQ
ncbi:MAG: SurA N-terminal domain-containing protein [Alphaproteobacteria bacterium]|nr:SurA N-terminal domain-containing protein [Alphaproteobacteria bacterium]